MFHPFLFIGFVLIAGFLFAVVLGAATVKPAAAGQNTRGHHDLLLEVEPDDKRLLALPAVAPAEAALPLKALPPLELDLASPDCVISCPLDPVLRQAAEELAAAIAEVAGRGPAIVADDADPGGLGRGPILVLGNLVTGALGRRLYLTGYDFTDLAWPGKGGYVVRTIRDPFGTGAHALMLGGSWPEDIAAAARSAAEMFRDKGRRIGYIHAVQLGENADAMREWTEKYKSADPAVWDHIGPFGSWTLLEQIGKAGMGFLRTGEEEYLEHFQRELLGFFERDVYEWQKYHEARRPSIHSTTDLVFVPWDLLADHPFFSAEDRRQIDETFLYLACSDEGPRGFARVRWGLHSNHPLGRAYDGFLLGRYFLNRYGIGEGRRWMLMAHNVFAGLMASAKPYEDNTYHQFEASLVTGLMYACAADRDDYFRSRSLSEAAERFLMIYPHGAHSAFINATAFVTSESSFLSLHAGKTSAAYIRECAGMRSASLLGENLRSFCGFAEPQVRQSLIGVHVAPLEPNWYASKEEGTRASQGTDALFRFSVPVEHCFDKATIRDGFGKDDFVLLVDGVSGGLHSFQDAGCITRYADRGYEWFGSAPGSQARSVRDENGMFVALDGCGPEAVHFAAKLLYADTISDRYDALGTSLEGIGDIDWRRHILHRRGAWVLIVDEAMVKRAGEAFLERHWHFRSEDTMALADGVRSRQGGNSLHLQTVGLPPENMSGDRNRRELVRVQLARGGNAAIAALLHMNEHADKRTFTLAMTADGWRISGEGDPVGVTLTERGLRPSDRTGEPVGYLKRLPLLPPAPKMDLRWNRVKIDDSAVTAVATGTGCLAAGTRTGKVAVVGMDGLVRWRAEVASWILSLHFCGDDLFVGEDNGTFSRFDKDGNRAWSVTIPYVNMAFAHWSDKRSRIHEITTADIDDDGQPEVLLANGDRRVYAYTGAGEPLWKAVVKYGIYNAMTPGIFQGSFALYGGAREPSLEAPFIMFGADGKEIAGDLKAPRQETSRFRDLRLWDTNGDGEREIVAARDLDGQQLTVCNGKTLEVIWMANVGGAPYGLAVLEAPTGERQILCASIAGYLHAFNAGDGQRRWWCYLGDDARLLWPRRNGTTIAMCPSGRVFVVDAEGRLIGMQELDAPVTGILRPGEHRVAPTAIPAGSEDGWLLFSETC